MKSQKLFIANYQTEQQVEDAIRQLRKKGYNISNIYVIGKDCYIEQNVLGYHNFYDRIEKWGTLGLLFAIAFLGLSFALLFFFKLAVRKPYLRLAIIYASVIILLGVVIPLISLGFSKNDKIKYKTQIKARKYILCAEESALQIDKMRALLHIHIPKENSVTEKENQNLIQKEI